MIKDKQTQKDKQILKNKRFNSYIDLVNYTLKNGKLTGNNENDSKRLLNVTYYEYALFENKASLPVKRLNLNTNFNYPWAETIWYSSLSRKVDWISNFGPIWKTMVDEEGNCNSNYGYQLDNNQNLNTMLAHLYHENYIHLNILTKENQLSKTDVPCNNFVELQLINRQLHCRIIARSIDLIYGLPYDSFAAQVFMNYVLKKLNTVYKNEYKEFTLGTLRFDIVNAHIYNKDINNYNNSNVNKNYIQSDTRQLINLEKSNLYPNKEFAKLMMNLSIETFKKFRKFYINNSNIETFINKRQSVVSNLWSDFEISNEITLDDLDETQNHIKEIIKNNDIYNRKTTDVKTSNKDGIILTNYFVSVSGHWYALRYKPIINRE